MAEKVALMGIVREENYLYYIKDGSVWRVERGGRGLPKGMPAQLAQGGFQMETEYIYFVDEDGDVSREERPISSRKGAQHTRRPTPDRHVQEEDGSKDEGPAITHGLQIRKEWLDQILSGTKTWEIRGSTTSRRGPIALIQSKSGHVVGTCDVIDVRGPLSLSDLQANAPLTGFRPDELYYQNTYAWVLSNARRLSNPVSFRHPQGAVIWVKLEPTVIQNLNDVRAAG